MTERPNRYERHMNQRALEKKSRAKERSIRHHEDATKVESGWADFATKSGANARTGIVAGIHGKTFTLVSNEQEWNATLSKNIPAALGTGLVVGDKVFCGMSLDGLPETIEGRQPRTSVLARFRGDRNRISAASQEEQVIAANVDVAVIVASKDQPAFHPRFVDRYLVICQNGGVTPLVCINKIDLPGEIHPVIEWYRSAGIPVVEVSAMAGESVNKLKERLHGKVAVLVGNSGVGKSSLIGLILGSMLETKEVSQKTGKGKHTTTTSSLYRWAGDSYLIDTPGIRSLGVFHIDKVSLQLGFPEFERYTTGCSYRDCTHSHEPICGVKEAVANGEVSHYRYQSYLRMLEE